MINTMINTYFAGTCVEAPSDVGSTVDVAMLVVVVGESSLVEPSVELPFVVAVVGEGGYVKSRDRTILARVVSRDYFIITSKN